jgi:D-proline reductase (dithiol) PrdB
LARLERPRPAIVTEGSVPGRPLERQELEAKFRQWRAIVDKMHANTRFTPNDQVSWTPLTKPLSESTIALVSTAGVHLKTQTPYDLMNELGDASFREIPGDVGSDALAVSHSHYDTADANSDPNVVFPIDRLRELRDEGVTGSIAIRHFGMIGWNPDGRRVKEETGPEVARLLREDGVDVVILTPG